MNLNPLEHPICFSRPRMQLSSSWMEHVPFAFYAMDLVRPRVLVELGTFYGVSYCAFCQAVDELKLNTHCYAVDTWQGDAHTGLYGPEVLNTLREHHDPLYTSFSRLIQSTFDDAKQYFSDGSIDFLHIDGFHTYEAVKHDFETWLPKLSDRAVVLFHDVNVREKDFGVWKFWEELSAGRPSFEFAHGNGLGLVVVGEKIPAGLAQLVNASQEERDSLQLFFSELGKLVTADQLLREKVKTEKDLRNDILDQQLLSNQLQTQNQLMTAAHVRLEEQKKTIDQLNGQVGEQNLSLEQYMALVGEQKQTIEQLVVERNDLQQKYQGQLLAYETLRNEAGTLQKEIEGYALQNKELSSKVTYLSDRFAEFQAVQNTIVFRMLRGYWEVLERLMPKGSRRRRIYSFVVKGVRAIMRGPRSISHPFRRLIATWKQGGPKLVWSRLRQRINREDEKPALIVKQAQETAPDLGSMEVQPLISVIVPVYNTPEKLLIAAIDSVRNQSYPHWELCICDDASPNKSVRSCLSELAAKDSRIKLTFSAKNGGISRATNQAAGLANGKYFALMDHDDELTPNALYEIAKAINSDREVEVIYSDQDKLNEKGEIEEPFYKPDWSLELFRSVMYVGHLLVVKSELFRQVNGMDAQFDGVQDFEFMLRVSEKASSIKHIPQILYHWRMLPGSIALGLDEKGKKIEQLQSRAVNAHFQRLGMRATAVSHPRHRHRVLVQPNPRETFPLVSMVILTKDAPQHIGRCLESIFKRTTYPNFEVIVVDNNTTDTKALEILKQYPIKIVPFPEKFNFSKANNLGVQNTQGEFIILLNNDIEVMTPSWVENLLFYCEFPDVAVVGPLLLFPDQSVQHAGVVLGIRGTADHIMRNFPADSDGYAGSLSSPREVSAVTGACLMVKRSDYVGSGGLVEFYSTHYQDVDFCLRFLAGGKRNIFVPYAVLIHYEGSSRGNYYSHMDRALLLDTWGELINSGDPYYNPNFTLEVSTSYVLR